MASVGRNFKVAESSINESSHRQLQLDRIMSSLEMPRFVMRLVGAAPGILFVCGGRVGAGQVPFRLPWEDTTRALLSCLATLS